MGSVMEKFTNFGELSLQIADKLMDALNNTRAISVSGIELNLPYNVFAMKSYPSEPFFICFNPKIVHKSDNKVIVEEECFSHPNLLVKISRPETIRVRFQSPYGEVITKNFEGAHARMFQHEMTHIESKHYWDDANFLNRNKAKKDWHIAQRRAK